MNQFPKGLLQPLFISAKIFPLNKKNTLSATIIAPIGDNIIVIKSVKLLNLSILIDKGTASIKATKVINIEAVFLFNLVAEIIASTGPYSIFTEDDIAAKIILKKNKVLKIFP